MNIVEMSFVLQQRLRDYDPDEDAPMKIRHGKFKRGEHLLVEDNYPVFMHHSENDYIEWYPSLEDLAATDWEFIKG